MSAEKLQSAIREKKTPVALGLAPEIEKISPKILKNFEEMFGPGMMANAETLRFTPARRWTRRRINCPPW